MAAPGDSKTALAPLGFRRLWTALGKPDDDGRWAADGTPSDHDAPLADEGRTFRLLDSGAEDLLGQEEGVSGLGSMSTRGAAATLRATVKPLAGVTAWVVAAAAAMMFLLPPGEADAYQFFIHEGHFDHTKKESIRLWPVGYLAANHPDAYKAYVGAANGWSAASNVKITVDDNPNANWRSPMYMAALYWDDPDASWSGGTYTSSPSSGKHWTRKPGATMYLNMGVIRAHSAKDAARLGQAVATHEVGHSLGLDHTGVRGCDGTKWHQGIMQDGDAQFYFNCGYITPQGDDTSGIAALYSSSK